MVGWRRLSCVKQIRWNEQRRLRRPRLLLSILGFLLPVALCVGLWTSSGQAELDPMDAPGYEPLPKPYLSHPDRPVEPEPEPEWWEVFLA